MKKISSCLFCLLVGYFIFAGDVAEFTDLGFSKDGSVYVFAQYGLTDIDFEPYAEIYAVDVKSNSYVKDGIFKKLPSANSTEKNGKEAFNNLRKKGAYFFDKYECQPVGIDNILYMRGKAYNSPETEIKVKDFENSTIDNPIYYHFQLVTNYEGEGKNSKGFFFVGVEKRDSTGKVLSRKTVGNAERKRDGVTGYCIEKIFSDSTGKNIVIVIEKQIADKKGASIRYMVETLSY